MVAAVAEALSPIGARMLDVSIRDLDRAAFAALIAPQLEQHGVLVFKDQHPCTAEDLLRFALMHPDADPVAAEHNPFAVADPACIPGLPMVRAIGTGAGPDGTPWAPARGSVPESNRIGHEWHTDGTGVTVLLCCDAPADGSRTTLYASGYAAYECLDADRQRLASTLRGMYGPKYTMEATVSEMCRRGVRMSEDGVRRTANIAPDRLTAAELAKCVDTPNRRRYDVYVGPLAKRHPETGRMTLFSTPLLLEAFDGHSEEESQEIIGDLLRPGVSADRVYEHRWQRGDVVIWDNRCMLHSTTPWNEQPHLLLQVFARTRTPMLPPMHLSDNALHVSDDSNAKRTRRA